MIASEKNWTKRLNGLSWNWNLLRRRTRLFTSLFEQKRSTANGMGTQNGKEAVTNGAHLKAYLVQKFDTGCRSGQIRFRLLGKRKSLRTMLDIILLFIRQEWRRAQQINNFFSRLSAVQRQTQMEKDTSEYSTSQEFTEEDPDLEAFLTFYR